MEIEVKFKLTNMKAMEDSIKRSGAKKISSEHEEDFYFDDRKRTLRGKVLVLRIRRIGRRGILTMKYSFKKKSKRFKMVEEIEIPTNDFHNLRFIFEKLGYRIDGFKEKRRQTFHLNNVKILIDRLPFLGFWMELEGGVPDIEKVARKLNLKMADANTLSYGQLFARFLKDHASELKPYKRRVDIFSFECEKRTGLFPYR
ncbi:MAG: class IV adenylate cyclase [Candidatus Omnitrophota bacterium]